MCSSSTTTAEEGSEYLLSRVIKKCEAEQNWREGDQFNNE